MQAAGLRIAIVVSRFNADITDRLLAGALACLEQHGGARDDVEVVHVPGAWELPPTAARIIGLNRHDAIIALGCVIRGDTPHFDYVCTEASAGLGAVARSASIPVLFGVLTTDDHPQALARAGDGKDNKGYEAAFAALKMVDVYKALE
ncbi:MAG TPA: 6,7-dimethyl-8-ribityllumazine synthase [Gemmatimonadetes bacterium]|nr:6,7-dimethyl-8-ribityllumazine synthase [Gemmatimonadota bacterium]HBD99660.1 6,7-dimethyl-8-ribityllumazine synthase [Gemmatimonadota bacterium]HIC55734.1 6,7-dimethyl-8-ribityllumazine synthase [Gemmatimonadota bacterium]HIN51583.1 6,7-dimethyl-8-ribityllumazine synthase [Gemmatimonadota bacterium]